MGGLRASGRRAGAVLAAIVAVVLVGGYAFGSNYGWDTVLANNKPIDTAWCRTEAPFKDSTPASFDTTGIQYTGPVVDTTPYLMPEYSTVTFSSRDPSVTIAAWWVPAAKAGAPAVILVHGRGKCRGDPEVLLPAGMLHRHGYSVLLIDLRNHWESTPVTARSWFGIREYPDVLGAWDWLQATQGLAAERIGLYGVSLGGASALIAMGEEPRIAATFEDSSFASMKSGIDDGLAERTLPGVLDVGVIFVGGLRDGIDVESYTPLKAVTKLDGRPIAIVHGDADATTPVKHAELLAAAVREAGGSVEPWILPGVAHVRAVFTAPDEYEARLVSFFASAIGAPDA